MRKFTFIDLFAGIGGFRVALESIGGECVFSSEWDKYAQKTYEANHGETPLGDITKIDSKDIPDFDVLTAGFPCQPFSNIGKRQGFQHPTQGSLFFEILRILRHKKPQAFILENVEGLVKHNKGDTFRTIISSLAISENGKRILFVPDYALNYHVFWKVLDAKNYSVPQKRKRIFIVGISQEHFSEIPYFCFPEPTNEPVAIGQFVEENVEGYSISQHLQNVYIFKKDDGKPEIIDKDSKIQVKTLVSTYYKIQRLTGTFVKGGNTGLRLLTENECKAIMGFDKNFKIPVSRTQMYRQMGNSVAVPVVTAIAKQLASFITQKQNFPQRIHHDKSSRISQRVF